MSEARAEQFERADDRVRHPAAELARRLRRVDEEVQVERAGAFLEQVKEHEPKWRDHEDRGEATRRREARPLLILRQEWRKSRQAVFIR